MVEYAPARPGDTGCAVVAGGFVALVDVGVRPELVARIHAAFAGSALLERTVSEIVAAVPDARFAIARTDTAPARIALRGDLTIDLGPSATTRFGLPSGSTGVLGEVDGLERLSFTLGTDDESPHRLPLRDGACPASAVHATFAHAPGEGTALSPQSADDQAQGEAAAVASDRSGWVLTLPDGRELDARPRLVVGRRPEEDESTDTGALYVTAPSPQREISARHLELTVEDDVLRARDMGSTNGTLVLRPDRPAHLLHDSRDATLDAGDTLDLGEGFRITVARRR
ncbi:FHA domain-containing protein [Demequina zhanjiangensis]|uniref:FHA domain-containing protein n=1 Tax=Demequina zhanjiangensis TaxID=3051659 RepID=A0ABT8FX70_9MICO|nr:FHA domain-containing protein [Demequina sp. SYSU T00b26]MDN4471493.1 FHA domain-containing protein [Demequina sp. SYSU T00b26]